MTSIISTEQNTPEKNLTHEQNNEIEKKRKDLKAKLVPFLSPEKSWQISVGITNLLTNSNPDNEDDIKKMNSLINYQKMN